MELSTLSDWLAFIGSVHSKEIELGLDRVKEVAKRLDLLTPKIPVIVVGGTNGKGSTVAGLESIYRAAGFNVGAFTSPYLFKHNEQVRINGQMATDEEFCAAFKKIEETRQEITLTPFEFHTLAALLIFKSYPLDVLILEIGLGGRLDAVNIIDADVSIVTSIGLDHTDWLGATREDIAREKAGIFRADRPAVSGDLNPPATLIECALKVGAVLYCQNEDFHYQENARDWSWTFKNDRYEHLPKSSLACQNMSTALMAMTLLQSRLPVSRKAIDEGLKNVKLTGRIQIIEGPFREIYDVSHNPAAVKFLVERLATLPCNGKTLAVFSMLGDKDIEESINIIKGVIDDWYVAPLNVSRGATSDRLEKAMQLSEVDNVKMFSSIQVAYQEACKKAQAGDQIIVFGSFYTVSEIMKKS